jgi:hypothetical protein
VQSSHPAARNTASGHAFQQKVAGKLMDQTRDQRCQGDAVLRALDVRGVAWILDDIGALDDLAAELVELVVCPPR